MCTHPQLTTIPVTNAPLRVSLKEREYGLKEAAFGFMSFYGPNVTKTFNSQCL